MRSPLIMDRRKISMIKAFENENREQLKHYIETLLDNEELRNQVGLRGKQSTLNNFTEDIMIDNMVKVYKSLSKKKEIFEN